MIPDEVKMIVDQFISQGKMLFPESVNEEQIEQFETKYNVKLPLKYKAWLLYSDGGEFFLPAGLQMYGVEHKPLIDVTDSDKPNDKYIVIGSLASGDPILCEEGSEKISIYNHEAGVIEDDEVYEDFIAFLKDLSNILGIGE